MKQTVFCGLFFVLAAASLPGCQRFSERMAAAQGPVVARIGSHKITVNQLKTRLRDAPAVYQQYITSADGRRQFLNLLIREKILLAEAKKLGIPQDPTYRQAVEKFKADSKRRLREYEETLQIESALRRLRTKDLAATDVEVDRYYNDHRAEYEKPIEVQGSHILLSTEEDARAALGRLQAGESFEQVAKEMSKDPATAVRGGKLTPFRRGSLVPEFEEAAFSLKNGEVSGIVKTQFGFHIIRKLGQKQLPARPIAEVKDEIRSKLERDKFNQWVTTKQALLGVQVDEPMMSKVTLEESSKP